MSRPANTVGGDFYDILPLDDGRLVITLGDVAGKGSPAALLMALLLAMLRTLVDESSSRPTDHAPQRQVCRHAPGTALHHAVLRRLRSAHRRLTYVQRRPHAARCIAARQTAPAERPDGRPRHQ
jgi:hypothetical protein